METLQLEIWQYVALFLAGIVAGFLNVMSGGGSLLTVPMMIFAGIPAPIANGTNRIALLAQNISATATFMKNGYRDLKLSISLALCALPGAIIGANLGLQFDGVWFNRTVAIIMIAVMIITLYKPKKSKRSASANLASEIENQPISKSRMVWGHILMVGIGFYGGIIQLGVGFLFPFVLNKIMRIDLVRCNMHKVFVILVYTIAALIIFATSDSVIWLLGIVIACGNTLGGYLGAKASIEKGEKLIVYIMNITLAVFIVKLVFFY